MAMAFGAEVLALHAHRLEAPVYFTRAQIRALNAQLRGSAKSGRAYLRDFADQHLPAKVPHSVLLADRDPVSAIQCAIRDWRPGLVVMATHGRTGLTRLRLGSVMESVVRQSTVPVLTVGPGVKTALSFAPIRRILCPVDLEDSSHAVFHHAAALAEATGAELIVLTVAKDGAEEQTLGTIREQLCAWVPGDMRNRCPIREVIRKGQPAEQIVAEAKAARTDLVVVEARPRRFLDSILFGSTTESVIRNSPSPVLSVIRKPVLSD